MDDFPIELTFQSERQAPVMRLRVAALCACLDQGRYRNAYFSEEELAPFMASVSTEIHGKPHQGWLRPHAFGFIQTSGNLSLAEDEVMNALIASIKVGELNPIQLRMSLDGYVDVYSTWIGCLDLLKWCDVREIELGELFNQYVDDEEEIQERILYHATVARHRYETPNFDAHYNPRFAAEIKQNHVTVDQYAELLTENVALSEAAYAHAPLQEEKPLQARERSTLLAIIAVLCKEADLDYRKNAKTAAIIRRTADAMGLTLGETTIEGKLKLIPDAIEGRLR